MSKFLELIDDTNCGFDPIPKVHHFISPTLRASRFGYKKKEIDDMGDVRIRKLTPKECWRLMGFDDADFDKAAQHNSNTQLYKQAGNSIVVDVLYYIFKEMM